MRTTLTWKSCVAAGLVLLACVPAMADPAPDDAPTQKSKDAAEFKKAADTASPSFQERKWSGAQGSYETNLEYSYVGNASNNLGNGTNGSIDENYFDFRHRFMRHTLLAFLVQGGAEYQHLGFESPIGSFIPHRMDSVTADIGIDFRWSNKDLLHMEAYPGFYTDFQGSGWNAFNTPFDIGYTRVVSPAFQWVVGFNLNVWRRNRYLGGAGLRWQINDRWKLKAYMPTPDIEYTARPNLTLTLGADIRGETYRMGPNFGNANGVNTLHNALVDYQEVRVGPGLSWNVRPTIEVNLMTGYMVGRQFDFHNGGPRLNGSSAPFVTLAIHALFKLPGEPLIIPLSNRVSIHDILSHF